VANQSFLKSQANLAANVKRRRLSIGLSQEELALRAGIDRTYASQIERAIANPSLAIICSIADEIGCEAGDLLQMPSLK
jgi:transcriptional regulator with XRE-family HTH domain